MVRAAEHFPNERLDVVDPDLRVSKAELYTPLFNRLRHHPEQQRLWRSKARFRVAWCGRRSGKTDLAIRIGIREALTFTSHPDGRFFFCAPTNDQAREIFWDKLKQRIPRAFMAEPPREGRMVIRLVNGVTIRVVGMDKPQRIEGREIDFIVLDEYDDMREEAWEKSIRPGLETDGRPGRALFIGKPKGRRHFYKMSKRATDPMQPEYEGFHWSSEDVLSEAAIKGLRDDIDPLTYEQEVRANFVSFANLAYYCWDNSIHASESLVYDPNLPLHFSFDFNVDWGSATVDQTQLYTGPRTDLIAPKFTAVIGEVWITVNSNTRMVCDKLIRDWGKAGRNHPHDIYCYGDATGGARGTSQTEGSDWTIIKKMMRQEFGEQVNFRVREANPSERARVNAMNSRLKNTEGIVRCLVDPTNAPHIAEDLADTMIVPGSAGELLKEQKSARTHLSDALGYRVEYEWPQWADGAESGTIAA